MNRSAYSRDIFSSSDEIEPGVPWPLSGRLESENQHLMKNKRKNYQSVIVPERTKPRASKLDIAIVALISLSVIALLAVIVRNLIIVLI